jgi:hypothetical protein
MKLTLLRNPNLSRNRDQESTQDRNASQDTTNHIKNSRRSGLLLLIVLAACSDTGVLSTGDFGWRGAGVDLLDGGEGQGGGEDGRDSEELKLHFDGCGGGVVGVTDWNVLVFRSGRVGGGVVDDGERCGWYCEWEREII